MNRAPQSIAWWRHPAFRLALLAVAFVSLAWGFSAQWRDLQTEIAASARQLTIHWGYVLLGSGLVLATHATLVQSWRMLLAGWGGSLGYGRAVQIWTIANLGKWIPGKVWQVGAMGMMAEDEGVSGIAAAGAALLGTLLNIGAGFGITALAGAPALNAVRPGLQPVALVASALFLIGVAALPFVLPRLLDRLATWRGLPAAEQHLAPAAVWTATAINAASWVGYGAAFWCFSRGVTPGVSGDPSAFVAVYTASYLIGYLVLFSPGGLGFRETALVALLVALGMAGKGDAAILALSSRVWITILEILPGVIGLLLLTPRQRAVLRRPG
ncbi:MAG: flippase-like domain-containing protein [Gemmatimonadaceae bacterium]|nr:flippase-like domain-containing protein [Gemmatimonadaceae bacterium]